MSALPRLKSRSHDFAKDPDFELVKTPGYYRGKVYGIVFSTIGLLFAMLAIWRYSKGQDNFTNSISLAGLFLGDGLFMFLLIIFPTYGAGRPSPIKSLPILLGAVVFMNKYILNWKTISQDPFVFFLEFLICTFYIMISIRNYLGHDDSGSIYLDCKPWIYKRKDQSFAPTVSKIVV